MEKVVQSYMLLFNEQVLLRFKEFPLEKLETLRMAAGTYHQLEGIVSALKGWRFMAPSAKMPVSDQLDKIESYLKKVYIPKKNERNKIERYII